MNNNFHYAFKVTDIESTRNFYQDILLCKTGRETASWIDFDFFGHQLSAHVSADIPELDYCGLVDGVQVPIPHFGCILNETQFEQLRRNLESNKIRFLVQPQTRYTGEKGEQKTMFVLDHSNNPLEFKCYANPEEVFAV
jgi:extradiol dioxygenase family protein